MSKRARSLRWLIGGIYFFIMTVILGSLAVYISYSVEKQYVTTKFQILEGQALLGAEILSPLIYAPQNQLRVTLVNIYRLTKAQRVTLMEVPGTATITDLPFNSSRFTTTVIPEEVRTALTGATGTGKRYDSDLAEELLYIAVPVQIEKNARIAMQRKWAAAHPGEVLPPYPTIVIPNAQRVGRRDKVTEAWAILVLAVPFEEIRDDLMMIRVAISLAFIGVLIIVLLINTSVSNFISRPLATLSDAAVRFSHGDLKEYVPPSGAAEIVSLGDSFNRMAEQLRLTITRLREERAQAEAILASMVDGVLVADTKGRVLMVNSAAAHLCNVQCETVIGHPLADVIANPDIQDLLVKTLSLNLPLKHEMTFADPSEQRIVEVHLAPVTIEHGPVGVVIVLYDVTHQRKLEQVQRDFVANVSHELRTPVTSIRAMAETLLEAGNDEPEMQADFLNAITQESERLTALLDSLLKLAHIEHDRRMISPEPVDLCELIREVVQRVIAPITAKHQHLIINVPDHLYIQGDRNALIQVLINLLDNARKYTPDGGVITVCAALDTGVRIQISDTGDGIPAEALDRIFERFYRVDKARARAQGGTGLGLAIVKHLVEMHGGHILAESELGVGSTFTVILPPPSFEEPTPEEEGELPSGVSNRVSGIPS